jgi:arylsulfatase A-like enzyme
VRARAGTFNLRDPLHLITQILPRRFEDFLDTRDASRPFCAPISFKAPHAPLEDWDSRFASLYHGVEIPLPESFSLTPDPTLPAALRDSYSGFNPLLAGDVEIVRGKHRHVYRHISGLDLSVGLMLQALAERGLDRDTVVVFSSDNGHLMGEHGLWGKSLMYEESLRVPLLICDPRQRAWVQRESDAMVLNVDLAPTLCELGGIAPAADADGTSLVPLLRGERDSVRDIWLFEHQFRTQQAALPRNRGVRTARWKYLRLLDPVPAVEMLFDLEVDPFERRNLAQDPASRDMLLALRTRYQELAAPPRKPETR